ncbi:RagB/SusD family protein [Aequorivita sublithincola DSM 14238]|uniref:RagB/SusD family protein n=1 Tax=Aequorivita sublithincola (strain DSM 14238 / LMG 21431 / ACAM 643 / 9-3) TaxID=746697 RepID=I3YZV5_AEQSU|nr:RagB/SusD family nutrient uptake outer membrane protein [Aequorivita sublithincola]AFL82523.1 RagB/SusD family protein [Aequorivita sublithincola DSM 14238]
METKKNIYRRPLFSILAITSLFALFSCQEFVELDPPNYLISGETLFTDKGTVEAAILGIYGKLRTNVLLTGSSEGLSNLMGNYADEMDFYGDLNLADEDFFKNNLLATNQTVESVWNGSYNLIYSANAIIEGMEDSLYFSPEEAAQFSGEAKFLRALIHFYLYNLYGEVPYVKTTNYIENKTVKRDSKETVYSNLIADLIDAKNSLPDLDPSDEHVRADALTATALLARVYLYNEQWQAAEEMASLVIANTTWETDLESVFLKESPTTILQLMPEFDGMNTLEAQTFIFETAPPPVRALTFNLMDGFEEGDLRKSIWTQGVSDGTQTFYYPFKYQHQAGESSNSEYSILFRLAEQFLIRAEARTKLGDMAGAQADLNIIRTRAGLPAIQPMGNDAMIQAILKERRFEFFTEHGHRFFDLKRTNNLDNILGSLKPSWKSTDKLFPLPERELKVNPNLEPQNPGY